MLQTRVSDLGDGLPRPVYAEACPTVTVYAMGMRNPRMIRYSLALACFLFAFPLAAQQASGKITGVVTDATGAVIPGVAVTATNTQTGDIRKTETNASGVYVVSPLPVGDYK